MAAGQLTRPSMLNWHMKLVMNWAMFSTCKRGGGHWIESRPVADDWVSEFTLTLMPFLMPWDTRISMEALAVALILGQNPGPLLMLVPIR